MAIIVNYRYYLLPATNAANFLIDAFENGSIMHGSARRRAASTGKCNLVELVERYVLLESRNFRLIDVLADFPAELLDTRVWPVWP